MNCCNAYGIDLGTTNSVACIYKAGRLDILKSKFTEPYYPSVVSFPEKGNQSFLVGKIAKQKMKTKPQEVVYNVKRLFGVEYKSKIVETMKKTCSFTIQDDGNNKPIIAYKQNGKINQKYPQEISALVLSNIAADMKEFAGFDIKDVVITVPAYFNRHQRRLTEDAAKIAGLNVLEIITEPEAAAFAYLDDNQLKKERVVLLYDLGGGTFDVTIMRISGMKFEELALDGNLFLGGSDFDSEIMKAYMKDYEIKMNEPFPQKQLSKLRYHCENAKIDLKNQTETTIDFIDTFRWTLSQQRMNMMLEDKIRETLKVCDAALKSAKLKPSDIDDLLFVGGSTYLNKVEEMVPAYFGKDSPSYVINREEAIATGAAKYALFLQENKEGFTHVSLTLDQKEEPAELAPLPSFTMSGEIPSYIVEEVSQFPQIGNGLEQQHINLIDPNFSIQTICSGTIGIADGHRCFRPFIRKGRRLPYSTDFELHNSEANMEELNITLLQGEHSHPHRNAVISRIRITGIQPKPVGMNTFYMHLDMDEHGSLSVRVIDFDTGKEMVIEDVFASMTKEEIQKKKGILEEEIERNMLAEKIDKRKNELIYSLNELTRLKPQHRETLLDLRVGIENATTMESLDDFSNHIESLKYHVC